MTDNLTALLRAVCQRPDEDVPRLVYADALDEYAGSLAPSDEMRQTHQLRSLFIRKQVECNYSACEKCNAQASEIYFSGASLGGRRGFGKCKSKPPCPAPKMRRELSALLLRPVRCPSPLHHIKYSLGSYMVNELRPLAHWWRVEFSRGFIDSLSISETAFFAQAAEFVLRAPVVRFDLTNPVAGIIDPTILTRRPGPYPIKGEWCNPYGDLHRLYDDQWPPPFLSLVKTHWPSPFKDAQSRALNRVYQLALQRAAFVYARKEAGLPYIDPESIIRGFRCPPWAEPWAERGK